MKRIRLLVVEPTEEQFMQAVASLSEAELREQTPAIRQRMIVRYKGVIQTALRTPLDGQAGITIEEMERSLSILNVVEAVPDGGVLELEDADHEYLLQKLAKVRWVGIDPRIVTLVHTIRNATKDLLEPGQTTSQNGVHHDPGVALPAPGPGVTPAG